MVYAMDHCSKRQHTPLLEATLQNFMELKRELTFHYLRAIFLIFKHSQCILIFNHCMLEIAYHYYKLTAITFAKH